MSYYYTCGIHKEFHWVDCLRSEDGFKEFNAPQNYKRIRHFLFAKDVAETNLPMSVSLGSKQVSTGTEDLALRMIRLDMNAPAVFLLDKQ